LKFADSLLPLVSRSQGGVIALVGAGGKTSALFGLAGELADDSPSGALMTTTTHLLDPRLEQGRGFDRLVLVPALAEAPGPEWEPEWALGPAGPGRGRRIVLAAREEPGTGKLRGIHPARIAELARTWAFVIVEADGAKRLPVKAPAAHEPVIPAEAGLVLGFIGLDCLGRPMDAAIVHRPERFGPVTGCAPGEPVRMEHLAGLVRSPQGLFQGAPAGALRVLVLNKADRCGIDPAALLRGLQVYGPVPADLVLVCALRDPRPEARVLARAIPQ
jgi:probable selenium-dependent hydroxylase accessory protein YqeC